MIADISERLWIFIVTGIQNYKYFGMANLDLGDKTGIRTK